MKRILNPLPKIDPKPKKERDGNKTWRRRRH